VRRLSYLLPTMVMAALVIVGRPSWWAVAMLVGGTKFAWDWLWGDRRLLLASYGLQLSAIGCVLILAGVLLAQGLGLSLADLQKASRGLPRIERFVYHMPAIGIGLLVYGLLVWSRAWSAEREERREA
jgi:hypothetical protein